MSAVYQEKILNVEQLGQVCVEKYNIKIDIKQDVKEWIIFMCQEGASSGLFSKKYGEFLAT